MSAPAQEKLDSVGLDAVCAKIFEGLSLTAIAQEAAVSIGTLLTWISKDPERSARVREARAECAKLWDEKAEHGLEGAEDALQLAKAKELAHHYRWRAAKTAPRDYGDKQAVELTGKDGGPVETADKTPVESARAIAFALAMGLRAKANESQSTPPAGEDLC